jgi:streptomycin 6-kinase
MLEVPLLVRNRALDAGAADWLDELPGVVERLSEDWGLRLGRVFDATEALVVEAWLRDGEAAVLKVMFPRVDADGFDCARREAAVLAAVAGDGCARLLREDVDRGALLLERLGPSLFDLGLPIARRHELLCDAATRVWRPVPDLDLPSGSAKARWLADQIESSWEALGRPCSEHAIEQALACADHRARAHDAERAVLVHGDVHQWNALQVGTGCKLVDPDGLIADPEYDLGIIMREDPVELVQGDPLDRARWLAHRTGLDVVAIWEWGVVERVSTGLLCTRVDLQPFGRETLAAADVVARSSGP